MREAHLPELREQLRAAAAAEISRRAMVAAGPRVPTLPRSPILPRLQLPGRRILGRRLRLPAMAVLVAAAAVAAVIALASGGGGATRPAVANDVRSDGAILRLRFSVFGQPSQASDPANPFAPTATPRLTDGFSRSGYLEIGDDGVQHVSVSGQDVWLGAGPRKVCIAAGPDASSSERVVCARPHQIVDHGLFEWGHPAPAAAGPNAVELTGLVIDGVSTVTFRMADGEVADAPVTENVVVATLPADPVHVTFRDGDGILHSADL
ncbi:MAG TPA: hypothetical protein VHZ31_00985 [Solirubrobacteraceae bacterium]|jgi:hypothetical protein|nr:hypothetical protein [Solirubrobacteraceae bacterium]